MAPASVWYSRMQAPTDSQPNRPTLARLEPGVRAHVEARFDALLKQLGQSSSTIISASLPGACLGPEFAGARHVTRLPCLQRRKLASALSGQPCAGCLFG